MSAAHGPNIGHGYVKYVVITESGEELPPVVFPAQLARSGPNVVGSLATAKRVHVGGASWWTGEDAALAPSAITMLSQERLTDPHFIPALLAGAISRLGALNGSAGGVCVSGLPATWAMDKEKASQLGQRLRAGHAGYTEIRVIAEPLGLLYAAVLNNKGEAVGDAALMSGRIATVDLGHLTVDTAVLQRLTVEPSSLNTFSMGTSRPLAEVRAKLSQVFDVDLSTHTVDLAVRSGQIRIAGRERELPAGWDRPLLENASNVVARLRDLWGSGAQCDAILLGGGGAAEPRIAAAILKAFPHAQVVDEPQLAIARGYARLASRLSK